MRRRRVTTPIDALIALNAGLRAIDAAWRGQGYALTGWRGWRGLDGTATLRVVWRNDAAEIATIVATLRGQALP